jgi:hypothetical protein
MYFYSFGLGPISTVHLSEQWRVHSTQEKNAGKSRRGMQEKQIKAVFYCFQQIVVLPHISGGTHVF